VHARVVRADLLERIPTPVSHRCAAPRGPSTPAYSRSYRLTLAAHAWLRQRAALPAERPSPSDRGPQSSDAVAAQQIAAGGDVWVPYRNETTRFLSSLATSPPNEPS
jgi:hypothetical protein